MPLTLSLPTADIEPRHDIVVPGSWQLVAGVRILVKLNDGKDGKLEVTRQVDPNTWLLTWELGGSPYDGQVFEWARMVSTISANIATADWNCRLKLVPQMAA